ncbi:glycerophosphodiester phosphodiesterase family protein [Flavobacterium sp.]|uniref:glycerophosphodiester phosphodiesterase n=1 Tax=Flavobacterium sp. TaxID=239 RepID=UPI00333EB30E
MLKIGHRGAKGHVAENTLASFAKALELNVDAIELDVHLSRDGEVVVIHDETIDRTTNKTGLVTEFTAFELKQLGVPTLREIIQLVAKKCILNIEIKETAATEKVIEIIEEFVNEHNWTYAQFQISSFIWETLETISKINSTILLGVLTEDSIENALAFAKKIKAFSINPYHKLIYQESCEIIKNSGFKIYTWTVNTPEDLIFVKSLPVDGIISDFPDRI